MSKNMRKTNQALIALIGDLKDQSRSTGSALWRDVALRLEKSRSNWAEPNLSRLSRYAADEDLASFSVVAMWPVSRASPPTVLVSVPARKLKQQADVSSRSVN